MSGTAGRRSPLVGYLIADAVSLTGTRISMIAIPWLVLVTTGSATKTGLVAFAEMVPLVALKAGAGPLVDRVGARRIAIGCDGLSAVVVAMIPALQRWDQLTFGALLGLVALAGALRGPGDGAKNAFIPSLADHAGVPLERVTGLAGAIERSATLVGAAVAAGLVAWLGAANALAVDAASFAVCAAVFALSTRRMTVETPATALTPATSYLSELKSGWAFLRTDAVLVSLCLMVATTNLLDQAFSAVLVPVWARDGGHGIGAVGLYFATWAAASVVGALLAAWLSTRLRRFETYVIAFLITGLPRFLVLAFGLPLPVVLGTAVVGGVASGFLNPILGAVIFERIPRPLLGRVTSLNSALCWSLMPFGGLVGGLLVTSFGLRPALVMVGLAYFVATMFPVVRPAFRDFDRRPATSIGPDLESAALTSQ
ncbi:MAG: MFS transporter [Nocardioidaceae bacterium]